MIRLFASDLDGTLLNEQHECDEKIEKVFKKLSMQERYLLLQQGEE